MTAGEPAVQNNGGETTHQNNNSRGTRTAQISAPTPTSAASPAGANSAKTRLGRSAICRRQKQQREPLPNTAAHSPPKHHHGQKCNLPSVYDSAIPQQNKQQQRNTPPVPHNSRPSQRRARSCGRGGRPIGGITVMDGNDVLVVVDVVTIPSSTLSWSPSLLSPSTWSSSPLHRRRH